MMNIDTYTSETIDEVDMCHAITCVSPLTRILGSGSARFHENTQHDATHFADNLLRTVSARAAMDVSIPSQIRGSQGFVGRGHAQKR